MKNIALSLMLALGLVACTAQQQQQAQQTTDQIVALIAAVQKDAAVACKYIPEATTIVSLVNAGVGMTAAAISTAVCAAITAATPAVSAVSTPPVVKGVKITGYRIQ